MSKWEERFRSVMKAVTFRIIATLTTVTLVWAFTDDFQAAFKVGVLGTVAKLFIYYAHERVWDKILKKVETN